MIKPLETPEHNMGFALGIGVFIDQGPGSSSSADEDAVREAVDNVIAVGADPKRIAILDNFCWGDPKDPVQLGRLVQVAQEACESAESHQTPFISGKDSLNNVYVGQDGQRHSIPGTLIISAIGIVPDVTKTITMALKRPRHKLYFLEATSAEQFLDLHKAIQCGVIAACHDVSDGGITGAIAEMCIAGQLGAHIVRNKAEDESSILDLVQPVPRSTEHIPRLFESTADRFMLEVADYTKFKRMFRKHLDASVFCLGEVTVQPRFTLALGADQPPIIDLPVSELTAAFKRQGKYSL